VVIDAYCKEKMRMYGVAVLEESIEIYDELAGTPAESVIEQKFNDLVGEDFFDSTFSNLDFPKLLVLRVEDYPSDLFLATQRGGLVVLTIWNQRLLGYLGDSSSLAINRYWWEDMRRAFGQNFIAELSFQGILFGPNSEGDGLPTNVYGDGDSSLGVFTKTFECVGWNVKTAINQDFLTLQTIIAQGELG
jgi:hypothetical protein